MRNRSKSNNRPNESPDNKGRRTPRQKSRSQTRRTAEGNLRPEQTRVLLFNKPFDCLCQFTDSGNRKNLSDFIDEKGVYAAGRLDKDSEGLLLLTNDGKLQHWLSHPRHKQAKTYLVQVEGKPDDDAIQQLARGVLLNDGPTRPAKCRLIEEPDWLWERDPPIRMRKNIPTSWLELTLTEGRNRQVRRMTAKVGYPTLRLIRWQIGDWSLGNLQSGEWVTLKL